MSIVNKNKKEIPIILSVLLFLLCYPYYIWKYADLFRIISSITIFILCIPFIDFNSKNKKVFFFFALSFFILGARRGSDLFRILNVIFIAFIPILNKKALSITYKYFSSIFAIVLLLSIISYFCVIILGIHTSAIISPLNILKNYNYYQYPFLVMPTDGSFIRFSSVFDEAGVVGTFCGILLCIEKLNLKKWKNVVFLISGIASFSFYFYIIIGFILIIQSNKKYRMKLLAAFTLLIIISYNIPTFYNLIWYRFTGIGDIANSRGAGNMKDIVLSSLGSMKFYWGAGYKAAEQYMGDANIYLLIYREGFIFVALNLFAYIYFSYITIYKKNNIIFFYVIIIILATFYQRPALTDIVYVFLFTNMINKLSLEYDFHSKDINYNNNL